MRSEYRAWTQPQWLKLGGLGINRVGHQQHSRSLAAHSGIDSCANIYHIKSPQTVFLNLLTDVHEKAEMPLFDRSEKFDTECYQCRWACNVNHDPNMGEDASIFYYYNHWLVLNLVYSSEGVSGVYRR